MLGIRSNLGPFPGFHAPHSVRAVWPACMLQVSSWSRIMVFEPISSDGLRTRWRLCACVAAVCAFYAPRSQRRPTPPTKSHTLIAITPMSLIRDRISLSVCSWFWRMESSFDQDSNHTHLRRNTVEGSRPPKLCRSPMDLNRAMSVRIFIRSGHDDAVRNFHFSLHARSHFLPPTDF